METGLDIDAIIKILEDETGYNVNRGLWIEKLLKSKSLERQFIGNCLLLSIKYGSSTVQLVKLASERILKTEIEELKPDKNVNLLISLFLEVDAVSRTSNSTDKIQKMIRERMPKKKSAFLTAYTTGIEILILCGGSISDWSQLFARAYSGLL